MRLCDYAIMRLCDYAIMRLCDYAICDYAICDNTLIENVNEVMRLGILYATVATEVVLLKKN
jgi:hypothetical protein